MHYWKNGKKWHWGCCVRPTIGYIFWIAAVVFAVVSWISVVKNELVWGYGAQWWIWNTMMFGILALFGRGGHHCHTCGMEDGGGNPQ